MEIKPQILSYDPFISQYKQRSLTNEGITVPSKGTVTILNVGGKGIVTSLWFTSGLSNCVNDDGIIKIYNNGATSPNVIIDIGTLFATRWSIQQEGHFVKHITTNCGGGSINFAIPYQNGLKIEYYNPSTSSGIFYSQVNYIPDETLPYTLEGSSRTWANRQTITDSSGDPVLLDIPNGSGYIIYNSILGDGVSSSAYLESDMEIYFDRETTPSIRSSGLEDWFLGAWYWNGHIYSTPFTMINTNDTANYRTASAIDILEYYGGIRFTNGVKMVFNTEMGANTADISYLVLYYKDITGGGIGGNWLDQTTCFGAYCYQNKFLIFGGLIFLLILKNKK